MSRYWRDIIEVTRLFSKDSVPEETICTDPITHDLKRMYKKPLIKPRTL